MRGTRVAAFEPRHRRLSQASKGTRRQFVAAPGKECGDGVVLRLGIAGVVVRKAKEFRFLARFLHQRSKRSLAAHNLLFDLLDREIVDIGMRIRMISEVETLLDPILENCSALD